MTRLLALLYAAQILIRIAGLYPYMSLEPFNSDDYVITQP